MFDSRDKVNAVFARLYAKHHKTIYSFIISLLPSASDADDVMQETILTMCHKFDEYDHGKNFAAWGVGVARNKILKFYEKGQRRKALFSEESLRILLERSTPVIHHFEERFLALEVCLRKLKEPEKNLLKERFVNNEKIVAIAKQQEKSLDALYKTYSRILKKLKLCIQSNLSGKKATL